MMDGTERGDYELACAFVDAAARVIPRHYPPGYCVPASRIAVEVLRACHVPTRPLMVRVVVHNAALLAKGRMPVSPEEGDRWAYDDNAALVVCGDPGAVAATGWAGHVAAVAGERWLIDLALPQLSLPEKGITLAPLLAEAGPAFLAGREPLVLTQNGCRLMYGAFPMNWSYAEAREWDDLNMHGPAIRAIRALMGEARR